MNIDLDKVKKVHLIGIGGIGVSYIARYFLHEGKIVSGSDLAQTKITDELAAMGASVFYEQAEENVTSDIDLLIYSPAIKRDNLERAKARELGITQIGQFDFAEIVSRDKFTVGVAGNKGKTTTSAMVSHILEEANCDPTAMIGSIVNKWKCNYRHGQSELFVIEADEYREKFLKLHTNIATINNIYADHLDVFETEQGVVDAFQKYALNVPKDGVLIINNDDKLTKTLKMPQAKVITIALDSEADYRAVNITKQSFEVEGLGRFEVPMPGRMNIYNALMAIAVCLQLEVEVETIRKALKNFTGTWRRFEILGEYKEAIVVSDYAHNPQSVHAVIEAAKEFYPERRLIAVFQPHSLHRTYSLFDEFVTCTDEADILMIPDIYYVFGREDLSEEDINSKKLAEAIKEHNKKQGRDRLVLAPGNLEQTKDEIDKIIQPNDVLLMIGAGDIYQLAENLV